MPQSSTAGMLPIAIGRTRPATQDKAVRQAQRPHSSSAVPSELDKRLAEADAMLKVKMPVSPKPPFLANDKGLHQPAPPGAIYILSQPTHSPVDPLPLYYGGQTSPRGPPSPPYVAPAYIAPCPQPAYQGAGPISGAQPTTHAHPPAK